MGASTLAINLAAVLAKNTRNDVLAAELKPGQGTWTTDLNLPNDGGLGALLKLKPNEITPQMVEKNLTSTTFGTRLLCSNNSYKGLNFEIAGRSIDRHCQWLKCTLTHDHPGYWNTFIAGF